MARGVADRGHFHMSAYRKNAPPVEDAGIQRSGSWTGKGVTGEVALQWVDGSAYIEVAAWNGGQKQWARLSLEQVRGLRFALDEALRLAGPT